MGHRLNERNIGNAKLDSSPKMGKKKFTAEELQVLCKIASVVYDAMQEDEITETWIDNGNVVLSLNGEEMYDLFEAKRKLANLI